MKIAILGSETVDITPLVTSCTWSGSRLQAARKLEFVFVQSDVDSSVPIVNVECGLTVVGGDDDGNVVFVGNIYELERNRAQATVKILAYDHLWVLNRSKTCRKFTDALPEDIAKDICATLGVKAGKIAATGIPVSFIANAKTGYSVIMAAYTEAKKKSGKLYMCVMNNDQLDIVEKGELCGVTLNSCANNMDSVYREDITELVNAVQIVDENGNAGEIISNQLSIDAYSMFIDIYRTQKDKDAQTEAAAMLKTPECTGTITALGDYRAKSGYSLTVKDSLFAGKFYIKSDTHTWREGIHEMKLTLEFEALMTEVEAQKS